MPSEEIRVILFSVYRKIQLEEKFQKFFVLESSASQRKQGGCYFRSHYGTKRVQQECSRTRQLLDEDDSA